MDVDLEGKCYRPAEMKLRVIRREKVKKKIQYSGLQTAELGTDTGTTVSRFTPLHP